jgi:NAD(P)-dependent dehydrogenase (short-subunit alcohol dehydrogenase family)
MNGGDIVTDLRGKKALITGGAMGIGLAAAKRLVQAGCPVTIWGFDGAAMENAAR